MEKAVLYAVDGVASNEIRRSVLIQANERTFTCIGMGYLQCDSQPNDSSEDNFPLCGPGGRV
ncbi:MAG: hypothetical protein H0X34_00830 [Chthoniobacterales bacterium]|nr:hypothetical protein [Chthoniobacterales bacterium]